MSDICVPILSGSELYGQIKARKNRIKKLIAEHLLSFYKPALISLLCLTVNMVTANAEASDIRSSIEQARAERLVSKTKDAATKSLEAKANRGAAIKKMLDTQKKANEHPKVNVSRKQGIQAALEKMKKGMAEREIASQERMSSLQKRSPEINKIVAEMRNMGLTNDLLALIHEDGSIGKLSRSIPPPYRCCFNLIKFQAPPLAGLKSDL